MHVPVPMKAPENLANPSVGNIDEGEKRLDDIVQSNEFIGAWLKRVVVEITSDKENVDQNLVESHTSCCRAWFDKNTHGSYDCYYCRE